jgi:hypothetical protein
MIQNKVVLQYKDKSVKKGSTGDFLPNKKRFHLQITGGKTIEIDVEELKAVFFVKDFAGNKQYSENYKEVVPGGGRKLKVQFSDGEIMIGFSQGYSPQRPGFFLIPADQKTNNMRIYVVRSAIQGVHILET